MDSTSIDHRADIYSLGATLHFLLLGRPPYEGATLMATLLKHRDASIVSLAEARPEIPARLDALFQRMMAKKPAERPQTMSEVVRELEAILAALGPAEPAATFPTERSVPASPLSHLAAGDIQQTQMIRPQQVAMAPALQPATDQTVDLRPPSTDHGGLPAVLLVEPSRAQSGIIRNYLHNLGVTNVVTVSSGQEALKALNSQAPAVILSALHLRDMMGTELAKQVCARVQGEIPGFVLVSTESECQEAGILSRAGQAVVLHKPFTPAQLAEALSMASPRFLSLKPAAGSASRPLDLRHLKVLIADDSAAARVHARMSLAASV